MGVVLKARDADLGRDLAVKVLLERHRDDEGVIRRFVEEAQIGGQLQHPGIVPVHEVGAMPDRRPFFTMKLVKGRTLSALLATRCVSAPIDKPEAPAKVRTGEPRPINKPEARAKVRTGGPPHELPPWPHGVGGSSGGFSCRECWTQHVIPPHPRIVNRYRRLWVLIVVHGQRRVT